MIRDGSWLGLWGLRPGHIAVWSHPIPSWRPVPYGRRHLLGGGGGPWAWWRAQCIELRCPSFLDECRLWLISAVRETNRCAQSTPSLPPSTTENIPIARLCIDKQQTGSHTSSPANRDVTPHHDNVDSNRSPPPHVRAGDSHDASGHHCPGDEGILNNR